MASQTSLRHLTPEEIHQEQAVFVKARVCQKLAESRPGHCLRISTLPEPAARALCAELNADRTTAGLTADIVLLLGARQEAAHPWEVSATRLIELRNSARAPLLAFIPPGQKAAAEDSFDISTFAEVELGDIPAVLRQDLRQELPLEIRNLTDAVLSYLRSLRFVPEDDEVVRYYLTIRKNNFHADAVGGALYQLRLIPDFALAFIQSSLGQRLDRNLAALQKLVESSEPLLARIHGLKLERGSFQAELYSFLRGQSIQQVKGWGGVLASNPACRHLTFDCWPFAGESNDGQSLVVYVDDLEGLPCREPQKPLGADNPLILDLRHASNVKIKWKTEPKPATVSDLASFRIQIVSTEDDNVAWESKNIKKASGQKAEQTKSLKVSDFRDLVEDGLYYFRVRAYTESGEILNAEDGEKEPVLVLRDPANPDGKKFNESEDVWFWKSSDPNSPPPPIDPQRNVTVNSFLDAQLQVRFAALDRNTDPFASDLVPRADKTGWSTERGKRAEAIYQVVYDTQTRFSLPISTLLREIESETLSDPENLGRWRLVFSPEIKGSPRPTKRGYHGSPPDAFKAARRELFSRLRGAHDGLVETEDLLPLKSLIQAYAAEYENWLSQARENFSIAYYVDGTGRRRTDALFLDIDTVEVLLSNDTAIPDRVYLLAPTHPLRLLWHLQRSQMAHAWLRKAVESGQGGKGLPTSLRRYLRQRLTPVNLPPLLRPTHENNPDGVPHFYVENNPLSMFWSLFLREDVRDRRELEARARKALSISRSGPNSAGIGGIDKNILIGKMRRYLIQHPYIHTLKINIFNPGDAGLFVDAILGVEKVRIASGLPDLRYEVRLFTDGSLVESIGSAFENLIDPERQVSPEADPFSTPSKNPLFPKLRFYRNQQREFLEKPEAYEAHLTILHDVFPVEVELEPVEAGRSSFLHGLIQDQVTTFDGDSTHYAWRRQLHPSACPELPGDEVETSERMARLLENIAYLQGSVAAGKPVSKVQPSLRLNLAIENKNLLNLVHQVSDWVFIIDRNLGLEYFDSSPVEGRPIYLLDFVPEFAEMDIDRLLLTTRLTDEITSLIRPALEDRQLLLGEKIEIYFLTLLRSLSGRLALKMLSTPNSISETLGLAMARLFLENYNLLQDRILIPLDAHTDLFSGAERDIEVEDEVSFQRSDLLLVSCDLETRQIHFHLIEVKWRADLRDINTYIGLKGQVESQLMNTDSSLRQHFDPHISAEDRLDRAAKTRELIALLNFYLSRSLRYGLLEKEKAEELRPFIESLDQGYSLSTSALGLIFDFSFSGLSPEEEHAGLSYYRIGQDYIRRMLEAGLRRYELLQSRGERPASIAEAQTQELYRREVVEETKMTRDVHYPRVQTDFRSPSAGRKSKPVDDPVLEPVSAEGDLSPAPVDPSEGTVRLEVKDRTETPEKAAGFSPHATAPSDEKQTAPPQDLPEENTALDENVQAPAVDILVGDTSPSRQYGVLGKASGKILALDLNGTNTISLFGVQGGGKSYTVGSIVEMATRSFPGINWLPAPLATVIFHYHESQDYPPEFVSMVWPNSVDAEIKALKDEFGALPERLEDVLILTSGDKIAERRQEFPSVQVEPISFNSNELLIKDWRFLMGVGGNQMYMKQINLIMRQLRQGLTLESLSQEVDDSALSDSQKNIARLRLEFAAQFIDDNIRLSDKLRPGRLIIIDLRDELIMKEEALGLFVVMLNIFANAGREDGFNKLIVFDEAHKYMDDPDLTSHIVDAIRQMRHQGVSLMIASQDPPSLPNAIIELSSLVILHRFNSPQWLKHIQKSITALADLTPAQMSSLGPGEAYLWATKSTERVFTQKAVRVRFRPRLTQHGGGTKTAL